MIKLKNLLTEQDAKTFSSKVNANAKLKQLGMTSTIITNDGRLRIIFKHEVINRVPFDHDNAAVEEIRAIMKKNDISLYNVGIEVVSAEDSPPAEPFSDSPSIFLSFKKANTAKGPSKNLARDQGFKDAVEYIYDQASDGNNMTDDITDEMGDFYDDVQSSTDKDIKDAYSELRRTIDGEPEEQAEAAEALLDLLG